MQVLAPKVLPLQAMRESDVLDDVAGSAFEPPAGIEPVHSHNRRIPGSWRYSLARYRLPVGDCHGDEGWLVYSNDPLPEGGRSLSIDFRISTPLPGAHAPHSGSQSYSVKGNAVDDGLCTVDHLRFRFEPPHLALYARGAKSAVAELLCFRHRESFVRPVSVDRKTRATLDMLVGNTDAGETGNIIVNAQTQILLLHTLQQLFRDPDDSEVPACKFLDNQADREKIEKARDILIRHIGDPITIKALSRKAAINECYLKKGFKVMFGCTIFDFYQDQRMEHAKFLLYERGKTVSEVSALLGYSSISHFSTAFKRHTGLKPCELLSR